MRSHAFPIYFPFFFFFFFFFFRFLLLSLFVACLWGATVFGPVEGGCQISSCATFENELLARLPEACSPDDCVAELRAHEVALRPTDRMARFEELKKQHEELVSLLKRPSKSFQNISCGTRGRETEMEDECRITIGNRADNIMMTMDEIPEVFTADKLLPGNSAVSQLQTWFRRSRYLLRVLNEKCTDLASACAVAANQRLDELGVLVRSVKIPNRFRMSLVLTRSQLMSHVQVLSQLQGTEIFGDPRRDGGAFKVPRKWIGSPVCVRSSDIDQQCPAEIMANFSEVTRYTNDPLVVLAAMRWSLHYFELKNDEKHREITARFSKALDAVQAHCGWDRSCKSNAVKEIVLKVHSLSLEQILGEDKSVERDYESCWFNCGVKYLLFKQFVRTRQEVLSFILGSTTYMRQSCRVSLSFSSLFYLFNLHFSFRPNCAELPSQIIEKRS